MGSNNISIEKESFKINNISFDQSLTKKSTLNIGNIDVNKGRVMNIGEIKSRYDAINREYMEDYVSKVITDYSDNQVDNNLEKITESLDAINNTIKSDKKYVSINVNKTLLLNIDKKEVLDINNSNSETNIHVMNKGLNILSRNKKELFSLNTNDGIVKINNLDFFDNKNVHIIGDKYGLGLISNKQIQINSKNISLFAKKTIEFDSENINFNKVDVIKFSYKFYPVFETLKVV